MFLRTLLFTLLMMPLAASADYLQYSDGWVRAAPPNARMLAGYVQITNPGNEPIWIVGAQSPAFGGVMLHETVQKDGMAAMEHLDQVKLEPGQTVSFQPGGKHLMLMKPKQPLKVGDEVELQIKLGNGDIEGFTAEVRRQ